MNKTWKTHTHTHTVFGYNCWGYLRLWVHFPFFSVFSSKYSMVICSSFLCFLLLSSWLHNSEIDFSSCIFCKKKKNTCFYVLYIWLKKCATGCCVRRRHLCCDVLTCFKTRLVGRWAAAIVMKEVTEFTLFSSRQPCALVWFSGIILWERGSWMRWCLAADTQALNLHSTGTHHAAMQILSSFSMLSYISFNFHYLNFRNTSQLTV